MCIHFLLTHRYDLFSMRYVLCVCVPHLLCDICVDQSMLYRFLNYVYKCIFLSTNMLGRTWVDSWCVINRLEASLLFDLVI